MVDEESELASLVYLLLLRRVEVGGARCVCTTQTHGATEGTRR